MTSEALRTLTDHEQDEVWDRFYRDFDFKPHMYVFPAITEPVPSVTWSLKALDDDPDDRKFTQFHRLIQEALISSTPAGEALLFLDWRHTCYRLRPDLLPADNFRPPRGTDFWNMWPLNPYPDGDYHMYLAEDLSFGTIGHPWESSICVFGAPMVDRIAVEMTSVLSTVLRRDGVPGATRGDRRG